MAGSNIQRTIKELKKQGLFPGVVEKYIDFPGAGHGIRRDLWGFVDIMCAYPGKGIAAIQVCGPDFAAHRRKILEEKIPEVINYLEAGGIIEIWGWRKVKLKRGGKATRWLPRIESIKMEDFDYDFQGRDNNRSFRNAPTNTPGSEGQNPGPRQEPDGGTQFSLFARTSRPGYNNGGGGDNT